MASFIICMRLLYKDHLSFSLGVLGLLSSSVEVGNRCWIYRGFPDTDLHIWNNVASHWGTMQTWSKRSSYQSHRSDYSFHQYVHPNICLNVLFTWDQVQLLSNKLDWLICYLIILQEQHRGESHYVLCWWPDARETVSIKGINTHLRGQLMTCLNYIYRHFLHP